jgi:hypothetical protein
VAYQFAGTVLRLAGVLVETEAAPGSASKVTTRYFGNEATGDLDGDGVADIVFVLTLEIDGSGTVYYAAAALHTPPGWVGTNAVLLGDRSAPQSSHYEPGTLVGTYGALSRRTVHHASIPSACRRHWRWSAGGSWSGGRGADGRRYARAARCRGTASASRGSTSPAGPQRMI